MIDHESATPVYRQVAAILRERIDAGTYQPGRRLPSVRDLTQEFGIAQLTARKALRVLVDDGIADDDAGHGHVREGRLVPGLLAADDAALSAGDVGLDGGAELGLGQEEHGGVGAHDHCPLAVVLDGVDRTRQPRHQVDGQG